MSRTIVVKRAVMIARSDWRRARSTDDDGLPRGPSPVPPREERIIDATLRAGQR